MGHFTSGSVKKYGKDETIDAIEDPNDIYNESRFKLINAADDVDAGAVFGYTSTTEERSIFSQRIWQFQNRLPILTSRCILALPQEWTAKSITFNHETITPAVSGSTYTWELQNLQPISPEPGSPAAFESGATHRRQFLFQPGQAFTELQKHFQVVRSLILA
jgi:hypothetical protein